MSNNDLYCGKCKSHHHPVDCPMDKEVKMTEYKDVIEVFEKNLEYHYNKYNDFTFSPKELKSTKQAITLAKAFDSGEMPSEGDIFDIFLNTDTKTDFTFTKDLEKLTTATVKFIKPLIVKRDMRIDELEEAIESVTDCLESKHEENSKLKERVKELEDDCFTCGGKRKVGQLQQQLQASKEEIEKAKENWLALWDEKQNLIESLVAMKDKIKKLEDGK